MSSPTSSRWSRLVSAEYDLDCPNPSCNGWSFFAYKREDVPVFLILIKMLLGLVAKSSASLQPKRELVVRPVQNI